MRVCTMLVLVVLLAGCASGYSTFYKPLPGATPDAIARLRAAPASASPLIDRSPTLPDVDHYGRWGYTPIGYSSFTSGRAESEAGAIQQAKEVGADLVVVVNPSFIGSNTSHIPLTTPTTSTSHTSGSATAYGPSGTATAYGTATTTTYGTRTTYIPLTVNTYEFGAVFFIKRKYSFGANWRDLSDDERLAIQSNRGIYITSVVNDTPAFNADVLVGDIITHIAGQAVSSESAMQLIEQSGGQEIEIVIVRAGKQLRKVIQLLK